MNWDEDDKFLAERRRLRDLHEERENKIMSRANKKRQQEHLPKTENPATFKPVTREYIHEKKVKEHQQAHWKQD